MADLVDLPVRKLLVLEKLLQIKETRLRFALEHHVNTRGERMDFKNYPHIRSLYESSSKEIVLQGSVQSYKTEWVIIDHFAAAYNGLSIFYVLPKYDTRTTYVQNRINKCVENVREYKKIIGDGFFDSVALKQFGKGTIKYVGSNVLADFTEFPADMIIVDEVDECNQENVSYALDRLRASPYQFKRYIGNPRHKGVGINKLFMNSDMKEWYVPCLSCGNFSEVDWFATVVEEIANREGDVVDYRLRDTEWEEGCGRDIHLICECGGVLDRASRKGAWVAKGEGPIEGFHISMLDNLINSISDMWSRFKAAILNPALLQQFYNSELGLPFNAIGSRVTPYVLENCAEEYEFVIDSSNTCGYISENSSEEPCAMGVDVGGNFDVRIDQIVDRGVRKAVFIGKVKTVAELHDLVERYNVEKCVVDYMPETTLALEFQEEANCDVWLCSYRGEGKDRKRNYNLSNRQLTIDRTEALDRSFSQMKRKKSIIPKNFSSLLGGEYVAEMCLPIREVVIDTNGNTRYEWTRGKDHQRHTDTYCMLAAEMMMEAIIDDVYIG